MNLTDEHAAHADAHPAAGHPHRPDGVCVRRGGRRRRALHHHLQPLQLDEPGTDPAIQLNLQEYSKWISYIRPLLSD